MFNNPFNPLDWVHSAQDWFRKTEISSGFRPYLILLILIFGFSTVILMLFHEMEAIVNFVINILYMSVGCFIVIFFIKSFQDPNFCRSEKHVENVKRMEIIEQKGSAAQFLPMGFEQTVSPDLNQLTDESKVNQ